MHLCFRLVLHYRTSERLLLILSITDCYWNVKRFTALLFFFLICKNVIIKSLKLFWLWMSEERATPSHTCQIPCVTSVFKSYLDLHIYKYIHIQILHIDIYTHTHIYIYIFWVYILIFWVPTYCPPQEMQNFNRGTDFTLVPAPNLSRQLYLQFWCEWYCMILARWPLIHSPSTWSIRLYC